MNSALVFGKEKARFFHFYQESFISDIVLKYHQTQMAILREKVGYGNVQEPAESYEVKKCDLNNYISLSASGCVTIIRAPEIAFDIENMALVLKVIIQHGSELLFLNNQDKAR